MDATPEVGRDNSRTRLSCAALESAVPLAGNERDVRIAGLLILVCPGVAIGCGDNGDDSASQPPPTSETQASAPDLSGVVAYCEVRKKLGSTRAIIPDGTVERIKEAATAYNEDPTPELRRDLTALDGCTPATDRLVAAALSGQTPGEVKEVEPPDPQLQFANNCDYYLLDDDLDGYSFVASGTLTNTGNIGIIVRFKAEWKLLGSDPVTTAKTVRIKPGRDKDVQVSLPGTGEEIDAHQRADRECETDVEIVDVFGNVKPLK